MKIRVTEEERQAGALGEANLKLAAALLNVRGYAVMEGVFDSARLNELARAASKADADGRLPAASPFTDADVAENPYVLPVVDALVGADCVLRALHAGGLEQEEAGGVCIEKRPLFPETKHVRFPAHKLQTVIALQASNGPVAEVWPASHAQPDHLTIDYDADMLRTLSESMPSVQIQLEPGSVLIMDNRLWHRPAPTVPGQLLRLAYQRWWDITSPRQTISEEVYTSASPRLKRLLRFEALPIRKKVEPSY